jgi:hypothetical protein
MKRNELEKLVGGYSAGNLTPQEEERLLEAALQDQALFDELMEQQPLRELLADPQVRRELIRELTGGPQPRGWRGWLSWLPARAGFTPAATVAATVLVAAAIVQVGGWPERTSTQTVEIAEYRAPVSGVGPGEGGGVVGGIIGGMPQQAPPPPPPVSPRSGEEALGLTGGRQASELPPRPPAEPERTPRELAAPAAKPLPERDQQLAAAPVMEPRADTVAQERREAAAPFADPEAARRTEQAAAAVAPQRESAEEQAKSARAAAPRDAGLAGGVVGGIVGGVPNTAFPAATPPPPAKSRVAKALTGGVRVTVEFSVGAAPAEAVVTLRARASQAGSFAVVRRSPNGVWQLLAPAEPGDAAPVLRAGSEAVLQYPTSGAEAALYLVFLPSPSTAAAGPPQAAELLRGAAQAYPQATAATGTAGAAFGHSATGAVAPSTAGVLLVRLPQPQQTPQIR